MADEAGQEKRRNAAAYGMLHPSILKTSNDAVNKYWQGTGLSNDEVKAKDAHWNVWVKTYGAGCAGVCASAFAFFVGSVVLVKALDIGKGPVALTALGAFIASFFFLYWMYQRHLKSMTNEELAALKPVLNVSPVQKAYVEAIVALSSSHAIPEEEGREIVTHLNALVDEDLRLIDQEARLTDTSYPDLEAERDRLRSLIVSTKDPVARAAYEQSLEIAETRIASADIHDVSIERIAAQREMIRQAIYSVRESIARTHGEAPHFPNLNIDALRQTVVTANQQARAIEAAIDEVRTISG